MASPNHRLLVGWSKLVSSNLMAAIPFLLANAVAARSLGVSGFGQIAIILAYTKVIDGFFNFQSVNVLTRFLTEALEDKNIPNFRGLVKAGFLVDFLTALFACGVALSGIFLLQRVIGLEEDLVMFAALFCLIIPTRIFGVTEAILRSFDKFWTIGFRQVLLAGLVMCGWIVLAWQNAEPAAYLMVWFGAELVTNLWFISRASAALENTSISDVWNASAQAAIQRAEGFWRMLIQTNITFGIRLLSQDADIIFAGAVFGPGAAGLLRAAKDFANLAGQIGRPIQQVSSSQIARKMQLSGPRAAVGFARKIAVLSAAPALLLALSSYWWAGDFLAVIYGNGYQVAGLVAVVLLLAKAINLGGVTLLPLTIALGNSGDFLWTVILATLCYFAVMLLMAPFAGLLGIAIAHVSFELTWLLTTWNRVYKAMHHVEAARSAG
ncbi:lipopolysaccharide biosynthesis protein [Roseovarius phycicola]|uniref:O-antigen/teichoic acid export membrane protein n=1 Tax=Roseovarius phycicola TaxID=3080976 RepID=A0ABZ2HM54_9RHOB